MKVVKLKWLDSIFHEESGFIPIERAADHKLQEVESAGFVEYEDDVVVVLCSEVMNGFSRMHNAIPVCCITEYLVLAE